MYRHGERECALVHEIIAAEHGHASCAMRHEPCVMGRSQEGRRKVGEDYSSLRQRAGGFFLAAPMTQL